MDNFNRYRRLGFAEARQVTDAEVMSISLDSRISVSMADKENGSPLIGDMVARNPSNPDDQWLIAKDYWAENFEQEPM